MNHLRHGTVVAVAVAGFAAVRAQEPTPTFRAATTLVEFTLVASDGRGNPIADLKENEIVISERSARREVAFLRFEGGPSMPSNRVPLPSGVFTNRLEYLPSPPRNLTAIVMDSLNTPLTNQVESRNYVLDYLRTAPPDTQVAIYRIGERLQVVHDFTSDFRALQARLERGGVEVELQPEIVPKDEMASLLKAAESDVLSMDSRAMLTLAAQEMARLEDGYAEHAQGRRVDMTWAALEAIGNHLAAVPGRRSLVWITAGLPIVRLGSESNWLTSYRKAVRDAAQHLASRGVTLYPVDATGLRSAEVGKTALAPDQSRRWAAMDLVADVTGGRVLKNTNDLSAGMKAAAADLAGTYSIGFYVPDAADGQWHEFDVKVLRPGVKVEHRKGYLAMPPSVRQSNWSADRWHALAASSIGSSAIRFDARPQITAGDLIVVLHLAADDLFFRPSGQQVTAELDIALAERTTDDVKRIRVDPARVTYQLDELRALQSTFVRLPRRWTLQPGISAVRVIVRDRVTERYGVVDIPLTGLTRR